MANKAFAVHKNAPAPPRRHMEKADNSGEDVTFDT
jgi:hypothetical protein